MNNKLINKIKNLIIITEDYLNDIEKNREGYRIYNKIKRNLNNIELKPTSNDKKNNIINGLFGGVFYLTGVEFNLKDIGEKYDLGIVFATKENLPIRNTPTIASYHPKLNKLIFYIIDSDKYNYNTMVYLTRLRFPKWITYDTFIHEFTHYQDQMRYKGTINLEKYAMENLDMNKYFNNPIEYNAHTQEIIRYILNNKKSFKNLKFNIFFKKAIKYKITFYKYLNSKNKDKLKKRLYLLYSNLNNI